MVEWTNAAFGVIEEMRRKFQGNYQEISFSLFSSLRSCASFLPLRSAKLKRVWLCAHSFVTSSIPPHNRYQEYLARKEDDSVLFQIFIMIGSRNVAFFVCMSSFHRIFAVIFVGDVANR